MGEHFTSEFWENLQPSIWIDFGLAFLAFAAALLAFKIDKNSRLPLKILAVLLIVGTFAATVAKRMFEEAEANEQARANVYANAPHQQEIVVNVVTGSKAYNGTNEPVQFRVMSVDGTWSNGKGYGAFSKIFMRGRNSNVKWTLLPPVGRLKTLEVKKWAHNDDWRISSIKVWDQRAMETYSVVIPEKGFELNRKNEKGGWVTKRFELVLDEKK